MERTHRVLTLDCDAAFDIAADIERYPEFLRGCLSAKIVGRGADGIHVEQEVGFGAFRWKFSSTAVLRRPSRIDVTSRDDPFERFQMTWVISPISTGGCDVAVEATVEFRSSLVQWATSPLIPLGIDAILSDFEKRARAIRNS